MTTSSSTRTSASALAELHGQGQSLLVSELWRALDESSDEVLSALASGEMRRLGRNSYRVFYSASGGSGFGDMIVPGDGHQITVANCRFQGLSRQVYLTDQALIMMRASLACDVSYAVPGAERMVFRRPEVTLVYVPAGMSLVVDVAVGSAQQGVLSFQRAADFPARYGLALEDLPQALRVPLEGGPALGRMATFPVDGKVAALIADTLDSPLDGELRAVQCVARVAELVAFTLDAMQKDPALHLRAASRPRDVDLAHAARERLARDYRTPPRFTDLAHELGTNQTRLKQAFRDAFGLTMADYCLDRRMREAQQLLLEGVLTIAQVAERVGYQHQSSFTAAFQAAVGMSPRDYRKHRSAFTLPLGFRPQSVPA